MQRWLPDLDDPVEVDATSTSCHEFSTRSTTTVPSSTTPIRAALDERHELHELHEVDDRHELAALARAAADLDALPERPELDALVEADDYGALRYRP